MREGPMRTGRAKYVVQVAGTDMFTMIVEPGKSPVVECSYEQPVGSETVRLCAYFRHELEDLCQRWAHLLREAHRLDGEESVE
jgi:hypothetical protein